MNVFHHDLETVKEFRFGALDFGGESFDEVFVDDAVGLSERAERASERMREG